MKSLLMSLHSDADTALKPTMPELVPEEDIISVAASATHFHDLGDEAPSQASKPGSHSSAQSSLEGMEMGTMRSIIRTAVARDAAKFCLDQMPAIEPTIASLMRP